MRDQKEDIKEQFFKCECESDGLLLTNDEEEHRINFALYGYGVGYNPKPSLWSRIKYALYHIRTGKMYADSIIMDYEKARKVSEWIDLNTK